MPFFYLTVVIIASLSIFRDFEPEDMKPKYSQKDITKVTDKYFIVVISPRLQIPISGPQRIQSFRSSAVSPCYCHSRW
ncbi:hypothetical protein COK36_27095 [Bacillus cereus]|nr:hypothetical protein CN462_21010 [Bacillus cereus]PFL22575.1 hypothetical protein COJ22_16590 [Bacillus cereus]PFR56928.1 hypothetical protein COK36_27095 [Bacillus cereus]PGW94871.1 hypothetical protein COE19_12225 [Bacillus cereus]PGY98346.1 hypothetical protein COE38_02595 [Bacillus cereus]